MKGHLQILAAIAMAVLLASSVASAYDYGYDPSKATAGGNPSLYMELAQNPLLLSSGPYAGKIEYFFDLYTLANGLYSSFYFLDITGLDNSKIANAQTNRPAFATGGPVRTQEWGDPDGQYELWPAATGRIMDLWSKDVNASAASATAFDYWRSSYDDGSGGWADAGLGYVGSSTGNPHSYAEYVDHSSMGQDVWKAELTGAAPQPVHWYYTQFGITPAQDTIYIPSHANYWAPPVVGGLAFTLRVVYDEEIDPETIGWGGNATPQYDILGDFTVIPEPATMSLLALGGAALLRRRRRA